MSDTIPNEFPFPRVPQIDNKSPAQIRKMGLCPPFHGRCRCDIQFLWGEIEERIGAIKPMTSIGRLANCITTTKAVKPDPCKDYIRMKDGKWFLRGKEVTEEALERLNKMKIPPKWRDVVVATSLSQKVQAMGLDTAGRWQYRYSTGHIAAAKIEKFNRLKLFQREMVSIRRKIAMGIGENDPRAWLLALEDKTAIRIGSTKDFKAKVKAYGLTTLQNRHVTINGNVITLKFLAKKGIPAQYEIVNKAMAAWLTKRKVLTSAGDMLFSDVSASKLNKYLKTIAGGQKFTVKDFRMYHGTRIAYKELKQYGGVVLTAKGKKKIIKDVSTKVADFLHNTPAMARDAYIDPMVWEFIGGL